MKTTSAPILAALLCFATLAGCASKDAWVIVSVRDKLGRAPVAQPVITVAPRSGVGKASAEKTQQANAFGTARIKLATGQVKYQITVDAPDYDLYKFDLPNLDSFFPSGQWLNGEHGRQYPLRASNELELMVTLEP